MIIRILGHITLCLCLLSLASPADGESRKHHYQFAHIDNSKGLVNNQINTFYRDSKGLIWIGTSYGLSCWDGYQFRNFTVNPADSVFTNHRIADIQEDGSGNLWIQNNIGFVIYNPGKESFYAPEFDKIPGFPATEVPSRIYIDHRKNIFVVTSAGTTGYIPAGRNTFVSLPVTEEGKNSSVSFVIEKEGQYWRIYENGLLESFRLEEPGNCKKFPALYETYGGMKAEYRLYADRDGDLWVYSFNPGIGVWLYRTAKDEWTHYKAGNRGEGLTVNEVNSVTQDHEGNIWAGTDHGGINIIDKASGYIHHIYHKNEDDRSLCQNSVTALYTDYNGIVWIGTFKKGVNYYHKSIFKFALIDSKQNAFYPSLPFEDVNCFAEDKKGNVWIGTNGGGLYCYNQNTGKLQVYRHEEENPQSISSDIIVSLYFDKQEQLWIGTWLGGLNRFDGRRFIHYRHSVNTPRSLPANSVWCTLEDRKGNFWVATFKGGICLYDGKNGFKDVCNIYRGEDIRNNFATRLIETSEGDEIIAATSYGLYSINTESRYIKRMDGTAAGQIRLSHHSLNTIYQDSRKLLWIATENGLNIYDRTNDSLYVFFKENGLPDNTVRAITEDENHNIWVSTANGLSCITTTQDRSAYRFHFQNFSVSDGLQSDEFNQNSVFRRSNNDLWFGGPNGINVFKGSEIAYNKIPPRPVFSDFQLFGKSLRAGKVYNNRIILKRSITDTRTISLHYNEKDFTVSFSGLNYIQPDKARYRYRLRGFNEEWIELDNNKHHVTFTNLNAGKYTLQVIASNSDGLWNETPLELEIIVLPPFWKTRTAFLIYGLLVCGILLLIRRNFKKRLKRVAEQQKVKSQHELDEMKLRLFTSVSHEFRTPLSLILSPCETLLKDSKGTKEKELLGIIYRNAQQLQQQVDKLLDFRKLDKNAVSLNSKTDDIVPFLRETTLSFSEMATRKQIAFSFSSSVASLFMAFDEDKIQKIMFNLLSNAFKFTPEKGKISVSVETAGEEEAEFLVIKVADTGIGIKPEEAGHIFERFYQASLPHGITNHGSGIGLNLVKEFVALHEGSIRVESTEKKGSTFIVSLPIKTAAMSPAAKSAEATAASRPSTPPEILSSPKDFEVVPDAASAPASISVKNDKPLILVVDDNDDFRTFICKSLAPAYHTLEARNGKEALALTAEKMPDLIISDVMMPEMDGIEFCRHVRRDVSISHIPVILLTAKASEEAQIEGFETGADFYITKPFRMEVLLLHIGKLLQRTRDIQGKMQNKIRQHIEIKTSEIQIRSVDETLIEKAIQIVEKRMEDSEFSVEELSHELSMSRVHLYKKILSLTGKSPIEFIRVIRLKRAAQLLEKSQLSVSEIAYQVGFNNPKYFARYFREEYGMLPSEYAKLHK